MNRKVFDLIVVVGILLPPAFGLVRMSAKRWSTESTGAMGTIGDAVQAAL